MMELRTAWVDSPAVEAAIKRANNAAQTDCAMVKRLGDRWQLIGRLPDSYKRASLRDATGFKIDVNLHGAIFGLSETTENVSAGYGGSCMPTATLAKLLNIWADQQRQPVQGSLF